MAKKKITKKEAKKKAPVKIVMHKRKDAEEEESEGGLSLDDAFGDDEDVDYGKPKPFKAKKKDEDEIEEEIEEAEEEMDEVNHANGVDSQQEITIKASKPIGKVKKGDKVRVDGRELEVDSHYVLIDHGSTKEMAIELFDSKTDKDYQLRYFDDQAESTMEFYELQEIIYVKRQCMKVSW